MLSIRQTPTDLLCEAAQDKVRQQANIPSNEANRGLLAEVNPVAHDAPELITD